MVVFRIDRVKYQHAVLSGQGAAINGGRWNERFTPAVYTSESRSLAMLEILVHLRSIRFMPKDRIMVSITITDEKIKTISTDELPAKWNALPSPHPYTRELFSQYCIRDSFLGLKVPSVIVPEEYNYVLNPLHQEFAQSVSIAELEALNWDARLGS